jgi:hypothetical protein
MFTLKTTRDNLEPDTSPDFNDHHGGLCLLLFLMESQSANRTIGSFSGLDRGHNIGNTFFIVNGRFRARKGSLCRTFLG